MQEGSVGIFVSDNAWDFDLALKSTKVRLQNMVANVPATEEAQEAIHHTEKDGNWYIYP